MADNDDPLDKLAAELRAHQPSKKVSKVKRTLSLEVANYDLLRRYCRSREVDISDVVDRLIAVFIGKVKDDIPFDLAKDVGPAE